MPKEEKYQKVQNALVKSTEEFKAQNCAGLGELVGGERCEREMGNISQTDRDKARADWIKAHPGQNPNEEAITGQVTRTSMTIKSAPQTEAQKKAHAIMKT